MNLPDRIGNGAHFNPPAAGEGPGREQWHDGDAKAGLHHTDYSFGARCFECHAWRKAALVERIQNVLSAGGSWLVEDQWILDKLPSTARAASSPPVHALAARLSSSPLRTIRSTRAEATIHTEQQGQKRSGNRSAEWPQLLPRSSC
jgi:hypothetical protein